MTIQRSLGRGLAARTLQVALATTFLIPMGFARADQAAPTATRTQERTTAAPTRYAADEFRELETLDDTKLEPVKGGDHHNRRHDRWDDDHDGGFWVVVGVAIVVLILLPIVIISVIVDAVTD